jgi:hypothetical protein
MLGTRTLLDYLSKLVKKRSDAPAEDMISNLAVEQVKPGHIEYSDAVAIVFHIDRRKRHHDQHDQLRELSIRTLYLTKPLTKIRA